MLNPAPLDQLAALTDLLGPARPASPDDVLDAARAYARHVQRARGAEEFGRYCAGVVPGVLLRLAEAEATLAVLRAAVARHIAAADQGDDPAPRELLDELASAGIDLQAEVDLAAAVRDAETHTAAFG
ncbi:hypothetical protein ACFYZ8_33175 [Streptomyces sp. NPDC001668]|uniref:hypothetical protein n=1 Tax=Streptomyces sp. NPDC001668 TaxID=3364598 RepID=UPI00368DCE9D